MQSRGLFSGAQNIAVNEAIVNNVAGAYNDYRRSSMTNSRSDDNTNACNLSPSQHLDRCKRPSQVRCLCEQGTDNVTHH